MNVDLKISASNEDEGDNKKPRSREKIAWPSEDKGVSRRQRSRETGGWNIKGNIDNQKHRQLRLNLATRNTAARLNNETPEQQEHRLQGLRIAQARRLNNEKEHKRNQRLRRLRQNDFIRLNERRREMHDDRNTRNEYLANAWRTADQPLHQQQWVQSEMAKFHDTMNSLKH